MLDLVLMTIAVTISESISFGTEDSVKPNVPKLLETPQVTLLEPILQDTYKNKDLDNVCNSFFELTPNSVSFLWVRSLVYKDGRNEIQFFTLSDVPNKKGMFKQEVLNKTHSDSHAAALYLQLVISVCEHSTPLLAVHARSTLDNSNGSSSEVGFAFGLTPYADVSSMCLDRFEDAMDDRGVGVGGSANGGGYLQLAQRRHYQCVTEMNEQRCPNAEKVPSFYSISIKKRLTTS